jgi:AAA domain (dynein-related subfamily)
VILFTQDYFGSLIPNGSGEFEFQKGALVRAMENGQWLLLDELNLAPGSVLSQLAPILEGRTSIAVPGADEVVHAQPGFRIFATQNPAGSTDRQKLPQSLRSRFVAAQFDQPTQDEVTAILMHRSDLKLPAAVAEQLAALFTALSSQGPTLSITLRELIKWMRRFNKQNESATGGSATELWVKCGAALLAPRLSNARDVGVLTKVIQQSFNSPLWQMPAALVPAQTHQALLSTAVVAASITTSLTSAGSINVTIGGLQKEIAGCDLSRCTLWSSDLPAGFVRALALIFFAADNHEPILLVGPTSCKSLLVQAYAQIIGRYNELERCYLSSDTEASDLLGQMRPFDTTAALTEIKAAGISYGKRMRALASTRNAYSDSHIQTRAHELEEAIIAYAEAQTCDIEAAAAAASAQQVAADNVDDTADDCEPLAMELFAGMPDAESDHESEAGARDRVILSAHSSSSGSESYQHVERDMDGQSLDYGMGIAYVDGLDEEASFGWIDVEGNLHEEQAHAAFVEENDILAVSGDHAADLSISHSTIHVDATAEQPADSDTASQHVDESETTATDGDAAIRERTRRAKFASAVMERLNACVSACDLLYEACYSLQRDTAVFDAGCEQVLERMSRLLSSVKQSTVQATVSTKSISMPIFAFKEGPVVPAVLEGKVRVCVIYCTILYTTVLYCVRGARLHVLYVDHIASTVQHFAGRKSLLIKISMPTYIHLQHYTAAHTDPGLRRL